jgi:hypothetical protein
MKKYDINGVNVGVYRVNNCVNGNPRYVLHFMYIADDYEDAIQISKKIGGKKYRGRDFGGGIVFTSYSLRDDLKKIIRG